MKKIRVLAVLLALAAVLLAGCESSYGNLISSERAAAIGGEQQETEKAAETVAKPAPQPYRSGDAQLYFKADGQYLCAYDGEACQEMYI